MFSLPLKAKALVAQLCLTLHDPLDCSPPGSSVHGILQARRLGRVAISFSRRSSQPRDQTRVSCIGGRFFTIWAPRESPDFRATPAAVLREDGRRQGQTREGPLGSNCNSLRWDGSGLDESGSRREQRRLDSDALLKAEPS